MFELEIKILMLTAVYFTGWFLFEKIFSALWTRVYPEPPTGKSATKRRIPPLAVVTPLDQTWRYIKGLQSPDWRIRRISCVQLGEKRGTAVVNALIEALNDSREEVSIAASEALAKIGDPLAINALSNHLQNLEGRTDRTYERYRAA